jgi:hypothetical protein
MSEEYYDANGGPIDALEQKVNDLDREIETLKSRVDRLDLNDDHTLHQQKQYIADYNKRQGMQEQLKKTIGAPVEGGRRNTRRQGKKRGKKSLRKRK